MISNEIEKINELYDKQVREYQEFKTSESALNAKASVHIEQMEETLASIPKHILESLNLVPPSNSNEITVEQMGEYSKRVSDTLNSLTDKIKNYLETGNIEYLRGIEVVVGIDKIPEPLQMNSLQQDASQQNHTTSTQHSEESKIAEQTLNVDPFSQSSAVAILNNSSEGDAN